MVFSEGESSLREKGIKNSDLPGFFLDCRTCAFVPGSLSGPLLD
ncbi:hypothetical protein LptCag_1728 [Leptospirillum ferriphilum]|uniref:Uncharacterized protein n=1 Tax=Leptospirillum ferriphilum TaxID=178606 RepID=A0A094X222_9BACT|nr:hypothetical protein LptCag_1728 [Leptospirillum ferriphilum]